MKKIILAFALMPLSSFAQTDTVYITKEIDEVKVVQKGFVPEVRNEGQSEIVNIEKLSSIPRIMGSVDVLRYMQSLGGVSSNSELQAGIYVQGCENQHSRLTLDGATVYCPNHLFGLFSGFITGQLSDAKIQTGQHGADFGNRIGASVDLVSFSDSDRKFGAEISAGLISSEATIKARTGNTGALIASARKTYINALYSSFLQFNGTSLEYGFYDWDIAYTAFKTRTQTLKISANSTKDELVFAGNGSLYDFDVDWENTAVSAAYRYKKFSTTASFSRYNNFVLATQQDADEIEMPSTINSVTINSNISDLESDRLKLKFGADYTHYYTKPQCILAPADKEGFAKPEQTADEFSVYSDLGFDFTESLKLFGGLRYSWYYGDGKFYSGLDPRVRLELSPSGKNYTISAHYGLYHQYIHQSGMTTGGMPIEFWFCSDDNYKSQYANEFGLKFNGFTDKKRYTFSAEIYYKQLYNTYECRTSLTEIFNSRSSEIDDFMRADGRNYGIELEAVKNKGRLTGHLSYTLGRALRKFDELEGGYKYSSSHERIQDFSAVSSYKLNEKWQLSAMMTLASGTAFTSPRSAFYMNGNLICEYGDYNAARLPVYHHLDVSANYLIWQHDERKLLVNFSIYNIYNHKNVLTLSVPRQEFTLRESTVLGILPSVSFTFKF